MPTNPTPTDKPEMRERAREVLAQHAEKNGYPLAAKSIRTGDDPWFYTVCAQAMLTFATTIAAEARLQERERAARIAESGYRCRTCNAVFNEVEGHPSPECSYPNWDRLTDVQAATAIRSSTGEGA